MLYRIAGGEEVAGVGSQGEAFVQAFDVLGGDRADGADKRLVAGLQGITRMQAGGVAGTGGLGSQAAVEFDLQAEECPSADAYSLPFRLALPVGQALRTFRRSHQQE